MSWEEWVQSKYNKKTAEYNKFVLDNGTPRRIYTTKINPTPNSDFNYYLCETTNAKDKIVANFKYTFEIIIIWD